jgi:hypothetical protein
VLIQPRLRVRLNCRRWLFRFGRIPHALGAVLEVQRRDAQARDACHLPGVAGSLSVAVHRVSSSCAIDIRSRSICTRVAIGALDVTHGHELASALLLDLPARA